MKKVLLPLFSLLIAVSVSAAAFKKPMAVNRQNMKPMTEDVADVLQMNYLITALYNNSDYKVPNYYIILTDSESAKYDSNTGSISAPSGSYALILDLFNHTPEDGVYLLPGTYTMLADDYTEAPFGFTHEYSMLNLYDPEYGQISLQLENPIEVVRHENGQYDISTIIEVEGDKIELRYSGPIVMGSSNDRGTVYTQINHNITGNLDKGGVAYYQGVTDISSQGVSQYDIYGVDYDPVTGYMNGEGYVLSMLVAHKRFNKSAAYEVCPATYTNANNLARDTWYPAREIDYMGYVIPFGSYVKKLEVINGERVYSFAYLKTGTFTVEDNGDGTYKGTLEAETTLGYHVSLTWSGSMELDTKNAQFTAVVSDLEDDVELDFTNLDHGRIYHSGFQGGCRTFIVDLGSPSGKDAGINNGGDLLRMEFLVDKKDHVLYPGIYTVVPRRWNSNELIAGGMYEPGSLNKGYFGNNGDQIGTRYAHFKQDSYCVYDMVGPAEEGSVTVDTEDFQTYEFTIDLMDDGGFKITGYWNKPIEYCYDPESLQDEVMAIGEIGSDADGVRVIVEGSNLFVMNAGNAPVAVYDVYGRQVLTATAEKTISTSGLAKGIYVVTVKNKSIKVAL